MLQNASDIFKNKTYDFVLIKNNSLLPFLRDLSPILNLVNIKKKVEYLLDSISIPNLHSIPIQKWFLHTELYNNDNLFRQTLKGLYPNHCEEKFEEIRKFL